MANYRKKPVEIQAVQLCWRNWSEVCEFLGGIVSPKNPGRYSETFSDACGEDRHSSYSLDGVASPIASAQFIELTIPTLEGDHTAKHGDFIIKGVKGEFYPCKPDIFAATYDRV